VWSPWGPGRISPFEDDNEEPYNCQDELFDFEKDLPKRKRSLSWGGYSPHGLAALSLFTATPDADSVSFEEESKDEEPASPTTPKSPYGRTKSRQRRKAASNELVLPCPVLLGNTKAKGTELKLQEGELETNANGKVQRNSKSSTSDYQEVTTLMVRNLPYNLTQQGLVETLDSSGFKGLFDFCYLPHKFNEHTNLGFAFLNFVNAEIAQKFTNEWHQSRIFMTSGMRKSLNVTAAVVQGREANQLKACSRKMGRVKNASFRPWVPDGEILEIKP